MLFNNHIHIWQAKESAAKWLYSIDPGAEYHNLFLSPKQWCQDNVVFSSSITPPHLAMSMSRQGTQKHLCHFPFAESCAIEEVTEATATGDIWWLTQFSISLMGLSFVESPAHGQELIHFSLRLRVERSGGQSSYPGKFSLKFPVVITWLDSSLFQTSINTAYILQILQLSSLLTFDLIWSNDLINICFLPLKENPRMVFIKCCPWNAWVLVTPLPFFRWLIRVRRPCDSACVSASGTRLNTTLLVGRWGT